MDQNIQNFIQDSEKTFSFENQFLRTSLLCVLPIQANASTTETEKDGVKSSMAWFQLVAQFKTAYSANSEGHLVEDNATVKQIKVKFPPQTVAGVTPKMFKDFMDQNFVGKHAISLPVGSESQVYENKIPVKNVTQVNVDLSFNLLQYMQDFAVKSKSQK